MAFHAETPRHRGKLSRKSALRTSSHNPSLPAVYHADSPSVFDRQGTQLQCTKVNVILFKDKGNTDGCKMVGFTEYSNQADAVDTVSLVIILAFAQRWGHVQLREKIIESAKNPRL